MTSSAVIVTVNGEQRELPEGATVRTLISLLELGEEGVAVAVDGVIVPQSTWETATLSGGAEVDVLAAVQGG